MSTSDDEPQPRGPADDELDLDLAELDDDLDDDFDDWDDDFDEADDVDDEEFGDDAELELDEMLVVEPQDFAHLDGVALVTGGTGGIGAAVCRLLARRGADIAFTFRSNRRAADELIDELEALGAMVITAQVDLTDADATRTIVEALDEFGGIHTLVHAAGPIVPQIHLSRIDPLDFREHVDVEVGSFFDVVVPALPSLRANRGSIVAVTSAATTRFAVRDGLSAASKGAIETLVRGLAAEEGRFGVRANAVGPGMLSDGMAARLMEDGHYSDADLAVITGNIPLRRFGDADDVAEAVCFLASPRAGYISGQVVDVDGGYGA